MDEAKPGAILVRKISGTDRCPSTENVVVRVTHLQVFLAKEFTICSIILVVYIPIHPIKLIGFHINNPIKAPFSSFHTYLRTHIYHVAAYLFYYNIPIVSAKYGDIPE